MWWVAISFSKGSSQAKDQTCISCIGQAYSLPLSHQGSPCCLLGSANRGTRETLESKEEGEDFSPILPISIVWSGLPPGSVVKKNPPANAGDRFNPWSRKIPLEKEMATHSSILAWEISWTRSLVGYSPWCHKRVRHNLATKQQQWQHSRRP